MSGEDRQTPTVAPVAFVPVPVAQGTMESALALERWRGTVDEKLNNIDKSVADVKKDMKDNLSEVKLSVETLGMRIMGTLKEVDRCGEQAHESFEKRITDLETANNRMRAKVAVFAGLAGVLGGGISSAAFSTIFHKIFG